MISARRVAQGGLLLLLAAMPLHALASVWAGHLFGHQALWQAWKEIVSLVVVGATIWVAATTPAVAKKLHRPLVYLAVAFALLSIVVTLLLQPPVRAAVFGLKTDFEFIALLVAAIAVGTKKMRASATTTILISSAAVIGFGLLQIYILPRDFLVWFGYGPDTIQPFLMVDPAINAFRILATLGGPNQLGSFLILPICLTLALMLRRFRWWQPLFLLAGSLVMWHTYSRSAWLGLGVGVLAVILLSLPRKWLLPGLLAVTVLVAAALNWAVWYSGNNRHVQYYLYHQTLQDTGISASTDAHSKALNEGLLYMGQHPLGSGLGAAGPASYYGPSPIIPESYYLQIGIELGYLGLGLFVAFLLMALLELMKLSAKSPEAVAAVGALLGIGVINFFLHGWADSSTAIIFWVYAGIIIGAGKIAKETAK